MGDTARTSLKCILEAVLLAAGEPLDRAALASVFDEAERPAAGDIEKALSELAEDYAERGLELKEVASGFRIQVREEVNPWVARLWGTMTVACLLAAGASLSAPLARSRRSRSGRSPLQVRDCMLGRIAYAHLLVVLSQRSDLARGCGMLA